MIHLRRLVREAEGEAEETAMAAHNQAVLTEVEVAAEVEEVADVEEGKTTTFKPILEGHEGAASVFV